MNKLPYNIESLASLGSIKIIVSPFVPDNTIVLKAPKQSYGIRNFASYHVGIWNLDSGDIAGDCDITKATEMHLSHNRMKQLRSMAEQLDELPGAREEGGGKS